MAAPILVVDDDPKIVSLVKTYLEREGFRVITASNGQAALKAFGEFHPGLIVLDIMLPELDGLALMRILRERSAVPIVMLSARAQVADRVYGIHEGADDYLAKPFSPAELVVPRNLAPPALASSSPDFETRPASSTAGRAPAVRGDARITNAVATTSVARTREGRWRRLIGAPKT